MTSKLGLSRRSCDRRGGAIQCMRQGGAEGGARGDGSRGRTQCVCNRARALMLDFCEVKKLSSAMTSWPSLTRRRQMCEPLTCHVMQGLAKGANLMQYFPAPSRQVGANPALDL